MKYLQYSTYELEQFIRQQELENPLIELKEKNTYEERVNQRSSTFGSSEMPDDLFPSTDRNMRDTLFDDVKFLYPDENTQKLLKYLIYNFDDNGYLRVLGRDPAFYLEFDEMLLIKEFFYFNKWVRLGLGLET